MACEKELVVLEVVTYTRIHRQQQLGKCLCVAGSQPMLQIFQCKIIFVYENIFTTTTKKTKTNYITQAVSEIQPLCLTSFPQLTAAMLMRIFSLL